MLACVLLVVLVSIFLICVIEKTSVFNSRNFSGNEILRPSQSIALLVIMLSLIHLFLLLPLVSAHFQLNSPSARGFDEDSLATFPCGGQDTVSNNRSVFPLAGGPIQLNMEHDHADVQVLLALGNDPMDNFSIILQPIFMEEGIGNFCMGDVVRIS